MEKIICQNCDKPLSEKQIKCKNKFCSHSCSASFNNRKRPPRSEESKLKTSNSVKNSNLYKENKPKFYRIKFINCKFCGILKCVHISCIRKNCSDTCRKKNQAVNAINQFNTGYGKSGYYNNIHCQSRFELCFLIWCLDHQIKIERCKEIFKYNFNGKWHLYKPDFVVNNEIVEIKGRLCLIDAEKFKVVKNLRIIYKDEALRYVTYVQKKFNLPYNKLETLYN